MTTEVTLNPIGIFLAVLFFTSMVILFRWMFRVPPALPYEVVKVRRAISAFQRILVPVVDATTSVQAVELACRLGKEQKAEILLLHVVEVPFTLSLDSSMPEQEKRGNQLLEDAKVVVDQHGLTSVSRLAHHRLAANAILETAKASETDLIIMGLGGRRTPMEQLGRTAIEVLRKAPCEVILAKPASA